MLPCGAADLKSWKRSIDEEMAWYEFPLLCVLCQNQLNAIILNKTYPISIRSVQKFEKFNVGRYKEHV